MANYAAPPTHTKRPSKSDFANIIQQPYVTPPIHYSCEKPERSSFNPNTWSRRRWLVISLLAVALLTITIVLAIEIPHANRYPNYSALNYKLAQTYTGSSFFDNFNYFSGYDPAQGFVHYAARDAALALNLTYASAASAVLRVDTSSTDSTTGRISARVESKQSYNSGLFIFDIIHSPYGCSTWPALWLTDPSNWPLNGEIDVLEATNTASTGNQVTLHTTHNCKMDVKRKQSGKSLHNDCYNGTNANAGCGVLASTNTIGAQFNANNGGVYVLEYRSAGIRTWFFNRSSIPLDISSTTLFTSSNSASPNPSTWGTPLADFPSTNCDITSHFRNMSIIANIDLCGQLAGTAELFNVGSGCPGTCVEYVSTQPGSAYSEAYWEFGGWWVFQADGV